MADTIPDILVDDKSYSDINALSGLVAGTAMIITNKSPNNVRLQISSTQPDADSTEGEVLYPGPSTTSIKLISAGESTVWGKALGYVDAPLSIQDNS